MSLHRTAAWLAFNLLLGQLQQLKLNTKCSCRVYLLQAVGAWESAAQAASREGEAATQQAQRVQSALRESR